MRWFTDEAYDTFADDDFDWDAMLADYGAHVATISHRLPPDLLALATEPHLHLHDAEFREVRVDRDTHEIQMVVALGDLRELTLRFGDAVVVPENLQALAFAVQTEFRGWHRSRTRTVILAQEIDLIGDGRYVLRLRLWPFHEFVVEFSSLSLSLAPQPESVKPKPGRVVVIQERTRPTRGGPSART